MNVEFFDIAIVGSGFAANSLIEDINESSIALIQGVEQTRLEESKDNVTYNHFPLDNCTNTKFGGTSATWGGRCVDYNEIDFAERSNISVKWPISKQELLPFYQQAAEFLEIRKPTFDASDHQLDSLLNENKTFSDNCLERWSKPLRIFKNKKKILTKDNLSYFNNVHVNRFEKKGNVYILFDVNNNVILQCGLLILASGGLGSTKIMLNSVKVNSFETLGKYYQGHFSGKIANIVLNNPDKHINSFIIDQGVYTRKRYQPTYNTIMSHNLLNTALWLDNLKIGDARHKSSILSFVYILFSLPVISNFLAPPSIRKAMLIGKNSRYSQHLKNIFLSPLAIFKFSIPFFIKRYVCERKIPGFFLNSLGGKYSLHFHAEQEPVKSNKIEKNNNGGFDITFTYSEHDCESIFKTHELFDDYLKSEGIGHIEYISNSKDQLKAKILNESIDGIHQIGLTKMSTNIETGVVDKNLEVFGFEKLFILSSSVFPTSSQANPTFLLVVLAKRLSHFLINKGYK